jgi:hypothetical protein
MAITTDQQKRLLAAELAKHTYRPDIHTDVIELAERWLKFIEGGKFNIETASIADVVDIAKAGKR